VNRILLPFATGFRLGVALRDAAYQRGWFKVRRLNRPVISVGNLTVGGTGKTPFVALLAKLLLKRGWKPSILPHGYGRRRGAKVIVLGPRPGRTASPREVGDEPAWLAKALPDVPIVVGRDRYQSGLAAEKEFDVDVHILDDGFQHLSLKRDLDIVLVDATQEFSDQALLPAGRLREPFSALQRADVVVVTRVELGDPERLEKRVRNINPRAEVFHATTKLCGLVDVSSGRAYPPGAFEGERVCAFCGIGNPQAFFRDLRRWGFSVAFEKSFRDHHIYSKLEVELLRLSTAEVRPSAWVTTEKDAMNMPPLGEPPVPILACIIQAELREPEAFEEALFECLGKMRDRSDACVASASDRNPRG
jgi:tetraacyldisaccharide 4'-kinase